MSHKYSFQLEDAAGRRDLPHKLLLAQEYPETPTDVLLKLLAFLLFFRERLQISARLHDDNIPFTPDLVQLDYQLRPALWIECGDILIEKLDRLAVKAPEAQLWILQPSATAADSLLATMARHELRRQRYHVLAFDEAMVNELLTLLAPRNRVFWVAGTFDPPNLQFDFNGLWFDAPFNLHTF